MTTAATAANDRAGMRIGAKSIMGGGTSSLEHLDLCWGVLEFEIDHAIHHDVSEHQRDHNVDQRWHHHRMITDVAEVRGRNQTNEAEQDEWNERENHSRHA